MVAGILALVVAVAVSCAVVIYRRRVDGRFRSSTEAAERDRRPRLTEAELGEPLGAEATVIEFSSSFCAPCRAAERVITETIDGLDGVRSVTVDVEQHPDLAREHGVLRTPTVLIADAHGRVTNRTAGVPTRESLLTALPQGVRR